MKMDVVILTFRRAEKLKACLASLSSQEGGFLGKVIVLINGLDPESRSLLLDFQSKFSFLEILETPRLTRGQARNRALEKAEEEVVYFLDDDCTLSNPNQLSELSALFERFPEVDVIGGPNWAPPGGTLFQEASGLVLASWWGTGHLSSRYGGRGKSAYCGEEALMLCNLAFRRTIFYLRGLRFDEELVSNEENLLLQELRSAGSLFLFSPALSVYHERRRNLRSYFLQILSYGRGRRENTRKRPRPFPFFTLIPLCFLIYLLLLLWIRDPLWKGPLAGYAFVTFMVSLRLANQRRPLMKVPRPFLSLFFWLTLLFPTTHLAYALGLTLNGKGNSA